MNAWRRPHSIIVTSEAASPHDQIEFASFGVAE
jgi:hypothetical protein